MKIKFASTTLLAAVASFGLGIAPALAAQGGYAYPDFWGTQATQQQVPSTAKKDAPVGAYFTHSNQGTWLFAPDSTSMG